MPRTVDIPGGTATFRESDDLRAIDRDLIEAAAVAASSALAKLPDSAKEGPREGESVQEAAQRIAAEEDSLKSLDFEESYSLMVLRRATILATLESWTLDRPLPTKMDDVAKLPSDLYQSLQDAIGGVPIDPTPTDFSEKLLENGQFDKESPTGGSTSSVAPSHQESPSSQLTEILLNDGESIAIEASTQG